ncbi:MAG: hypothetical protein WCF18_13300 [Chthoniobacteraceae bacterium]
MKAPKNLSLCIAIFLTIAASAGAADPVTDLLNEAKTAVQRGELDAAKAKLQAVKSLDPKNKTATEYLRQIQAKEAAEGGGSDRAFSKLIVPSVQFREAELSAVLEALRVQVNKLTNGKQAINFVVLLPEAQAKTPITLSLSNVPFPEVLKYIGTLANVSFAFDKYAITVRPAGAAKEEPKTDEAPKVKGL